jgi:hypothetical protein
MAQHDYDIADQPGGSFLADLNAALAAIVSQNSGATEPSPTYPYQLWADTTSGRLKMRNASNTAWLDVMTLADAKAIAAATADNATNLTGTSTSNIPTSALGSGTANDTVFLRGDRTWAFISTGGYKLSNVVRYTDAGSGTYNKPANVIALLIRAIGAGGGGGSNGTTYNGGGGGSGGYGESFITSPASSYPYTVGAGGSGGVFGVSGGDGNSGGATTIAGISAGGGSGGRGGDSNSGGGAGGTTSGADINVKGSGGSGGSNIAGGAGGGSVLGGAGHGAGTGGNNGGSGTFGGGGGGAGGVASGGAGGAGYIEIWEFI